MTSDNPLGSPAVTSSNQLGPRLYDERIRHADAIRRSAKLIKQGAVLKCIYETRRSLNCRPNEMRTYRVVKTVLVQDDKIVFFFRYRRDGRTSAVPYGSYEIEFTADYEPTLPDLPSVPTTPATPTTPDTEEG